MDEDKLIIWFKRRRDKFESFLNHYTTQEEQENSCDFEDVYEFVNTVLLWSYEEAFEDEDYEDFEDELRNMLIDEYFDYLSPIYYEICGD